MFCRRPKRICFVVPLLIPITILSACARRRAPEVERLAVLPIENLTSDAQVNWRGRAAASVIVYDLAGAKDLYAQQVDSMSSAQAMQASRLLEGFFVQRNGQLAIHASVEDLGSNQTIGTFDVAGPIASGFLPLMNEIAKRLRPDARAFGTTSEDAFRAYGEALSGKNSEAVQQGFRDAMAADPGFAAAYIDDARFLEQTGNRDSAREVAQSGERARLDPIERADLEYVLASARGDALDRMKALEKLGAATPSNAEVFAELAQMRFAHRKFQDAVMQYRAATRLNPDPPEIWNEFGYTLAWSGDLSGAREALNQYQKLAPNDPNALDSQGEVSYMLGNFKAAVNYFEQAAAKNPGEFVKAAEAELMMGDLHAADAVFARSLGPGSHVLNAGREYPIGRWEFLTGRRGQAIARMQKVAADGTGDLPALALCQLAVWNLQLGNRTAAADFANQAAARAQSSQVRGVAGLCRYLASDGDSGSGSKMAQALALVFANRFREAIPLLQSLYADTNPSADAQVRTLLAWAYVEAGSISEAAKLIKVYPLPLSSGDPLFASLIFPQYLQVRATVLESEGKKDEAARERELYVKYAGATK